MSLQALQILTAISTPAMISPTEKPKPGLAMMDGDQVRCCKVHQKDVIVVDTMVAVSPHYLVVSGSGCLQMERSNKLSISAFRSQRTPPTPCRLGHSSTMMPVARAIRPEMTDGEGSRKYPSYKTALSRKSSRRAEIRAPNNSIELSWLLAWQWLSSLLRLNPMK